MQIRVSKDIFVHQSANILSGHIFIKAPLNYIKALQASGSFAVGILTSCGLRTNTARVSKDFQVSREPVQLLLERARVLLFTALYRCGSPTPMGAEHDGIALLE